MHTILNIRFAYLFFIIAILFLRVPYFQTMTIKGDEGYFLMMGDLLIQGKKLYVDFLSLNSPLTCFFYIIPNLFPKDIIYSRIICSILIFITSLLLFHISKKFINRNYALLAPIFYLFQIHYLEEGVGQAFISEHIINLVVILFIYYSLQFKTNGNIKNTFLLSFFFTLSVLSRVNFIFLIVILIFFCFKNSKFNFYIFKNFILSSLFILVILISTYLFIWGFNINAFTNYSKFLLAYSEKHSYLAYFKNIFYNFIYLEKRYIISPILSFEIRKILISLPFILSHYFIFLHIYYLCFKKNKKFKNDTILILVGSLILIIISLILGPEIRSTHIFMLITINSLIVFYFVTNLMFLNNLKKIYLKHKFNFFITILFTFYILVSYSNTYNNNILLQNKFFKSSFYHNKENKLLQIYKNIQEESCFIGHSYHARWLNGSNFCYLLLFESFHNKNNLVKNIYKVDSVQKYYEKRLIVYKTNYLFLDKRLFEVVYSIQNGTENVISNKTKSIFLKMYEEVETMGNISLYKLKNSI